MNIAGATSQILSNLGLDWTILGNGEWCCGYPLILSGKREYVANLAEHNVEMIRRVGAKAVVTTCPGCYRTLSHYYPLLVGHLGFEVYHVSQLFQKMLENVKAKFKSDVNMVVTYHDPCDLGRLSEVYNAPRIVLSSIPGIKLVELPKNRALTYCCGGGGMLKATNPDIALKLAVKKVEEAHTVNAEAIISACASCKQNIQDGIDESGDTLQLLDLTEVVARAMGIELT